MPAVRRIGHKGADHIAPGNTQASFDAALAHGVDMIEFDVLPQDADDRERSPLRLAHDYSHDLERAPTLDEGLAHLAGDAFSSIELDVDLKLPGYEARVLEPRLRLGWSVPRVKRDYTKHLLYAVPAYTFLLYARRRLPAVAAGHIAAGRCDAVMCHYKLVTPALLEAIRESGGELYVWAVDDARRIRSLEELGVTGVITNDPRLFDAQAIEQVAAE